MSLWFVYSSIVTETTFDSAFCTIDYQFFDLFFKKKKKKSQYPIWSLYNIFGYIRYPL